jgi:hypothetical protein
MRRPILVALVIIAVPLYCYVIYLLLGSFLSTGKSGEMISAKENTFSIEKLLINSSLVRFEERGRDPFTPYIEAPKVKSLAANKTKLVSSYVKKEPVQAPSIGITGIMWNDANPVAMITLPDGSSAMAKKGQSFGAICIKAVEKTRIQVSSGGKDFWINR